MISTIIILENITLLTYRSQSSFFASYAIRIRIKTMRIRQYYFEIPEWNISTNQFGWMSCDTDLWIRRVTTFCWIGRFRTLCLTRICHYLKPSLISINLFLLLLLFLFLLLFISVRCLCLISTDIIGSWCNIISSQHILTHKFFSFILCELSCFY